MADSKWIAGLTHSTPLAQAARRVLSLRLGAVRDRLRPALSKAEEDIEHVHQLRVATRRARAAIDIFRDSLPKKVYRKLRKSLRQIRRGAGEARDWDVFLTEVQDHLPRATAPQKPGLLFLAGYAAARRIEAQAELQKQAGDIDASSLTQAAPESVRDSGEAFADLAQKELAGLARELASAAEKNIEKYEGLHELRIIGKRLRYAMEVFAGCYGKPFRESLYPLVENMQDILGLANDSAGAVERLKSIGDHVQKSRPALWKQLRPGIQYLTRFHERRLPGQRRLFERWWARWRKLNVEHALQELCGGEGKPASIRSHEIKVREAAEPAVGSLHLAEASRAEVVPFPGTAPAAGPHPVDPSEAAESPAPSKPAVG